VEAHGSYRLREHFKEVEAEIARLEAQAAFPWPKEADVLRRRGLPPDARVLEVGCGPGFITERLLALVPGGSVTAIDNDPEMVQLARRRLAGIEGVDVREASVTETGFDDASFDIATARLVFQHLPGPERGLAELHRVLRPGGRLFVVDIDAGWEVLLDPEPPHMAEIGAAVERLRTDRGGDPRIGRKLPRLLQDAGFRDLAVDVVALHTSVDGGESVRQILGGMAMLDRLFDAGLISAEIRDDLREYGDRFERGELRVDGLLGTLVVSGAA
jgi:SAM-dependent methyltransferase